MIDNGSVFVFPGQGAQSVGMGLDLYQHKPAARETFAAADAALGFPLSRLCFEGPEEELRLTENTQPAILAVSVAAYRAFAAEADVTPRYLAGHSFGEYSALVAANALSFADALRLVRRRGQIMTEALPPGAGTMAAIMGLDVSAVDELLTRARAAGVVEVATMNCPGQVVVAGEALAVAEAVRLAGEAGASKVIPLQVSGAFHSSLLREAGEKFAAELAAVEIRPAAVPVVDNVTARPVTEPDEIKALLKAQIYSPVRWEESIRFLLSEGVATFIEFGPGRVLSGLIRRIDRRSRLANVGDGNGLKEALAIFGEV